MSARALVGPADDPWTDDALTADVRVYQRLRGHRYSLDDVLTAVVAYDAAPTARSHLDLGCGLGSVLLTLAWLLREREARHVGIEAQAISYALARENVARNALDARVTLAHGDLREVALRPEFAGGFDLVTGTPPYVPPGRATPAPDPQKAYARIEYRGGVEAYLEAAARTLGPSGTAVVCTAADAEVRVGRAAEAVGLAVRAILDAHPREGRPALFRVFTLGRAPIRATRTAFVARDARGERTEAYLALRERLGLSRRYEPLRGDA